MGAVPLGDTVEIRNRFAPELNNFLDDLRGGTAVTALPLSTDAEIVDNNFCACSSQLDRDGAADAATRASDDDNLTV